MEKNKNIYMFKPAEFKRFFIVSNNPTRYMPKLALCRLISICSRTDNTWTLMFVQLVKFLASLSSSTYPMQ